MVVWFDNDEDIAFPYVGEPRVEYVEPELLDDEEDDEIYSWSFNVRGI